MTFFKKNMVHSCGEKLARHIHSLLWLAAQQLSWLLPACIAGVIARTLSDVMLFNSLFSDCSEAYPEVQLKGMRIGYPKNFWADLGDEVSAPPSQRLLTFATCCMSVH